jgi:hypothetical protein
MPPDVAGLCETAASIMPAGLHRDVILRRIEPSTSPARGKRRA